MGLDDKDLIAEFVVESQEGLAHVENQMLDIEAAGAAVDPELVHAVFRTMHSIKGTAGFLGLDRIGTLAHGLEEVLNGLRSRELAPTSEVVNTVLRGADLMKELIDAVETSNQVDVSPLIAELQACRHTSPVAAPKSSGAVLSDALRDYVIEGRENLDLMERDLVALEQQPDSQPLLRSVFRAMHTIKGGAGLLGLAGVERLAHAAENLLGQLRDCERPLDSSTISGLLAAADKCREGLRQVESQGLDVDFDPQSMIDQLHALSDTGVPSGPQRSATGARLDRVSAVPPKCSQANAASPPARPDTASGSIASSQQIGDVLIDQGKVQPEDVEWARNRQLAGDPLRIGEILVERGVIKPQDVREAVAVVNESRGVGGVADTSIRVDVSLLDKLMTRVGELVLARNQILQYTSRLEDPSFVSTAQRLNLITTELQEGVMKTRMQPIGNVWTKFPRVVRDLASQLGKEVRIEMEGKDTELDKTIVEAIKDPLTHLIRNAVDHGIEAPEARRAAGKPSEGTLHLRAFHEGGQVNIEIADDGAGLNVCRIRDNAVERGILTADQAVRMSDHEAAQIILLPGFSTAEQITSVSGRGVGMDVVKTNIERIGGTIDLQSRPGQGMTVRIKIPLTLAIIPALIVTSGGDRYAIPQVNLLELVRVEGGQAERGIEFVHGAPVYRLRGKLLPLVYLSERLHIERTTGSADKLGNRNDSDAAVNIIVLRANDQQFGLVVDKVNDTEEIVVKPLSRQLKRLHEYAGATIMGDGTVALILDVLGLALAGGLGTDAREPSLVGRASNESHAAWATQTLLIVDLGDSRRFALPTSMVSRLETVAPSSIEHADGQEVIQYRGAILPLVRLNKVLGELAPHAAELRELSIVVYADRGETCGFVVNRIVDIVEAELRFDRSAGADNHLLGTTIIQDRVTDVLNLGNLSRHLGRRGVGKLLAC